MNLYWHVQAPASKIQYEILIKIVTYSVTTAIGEVEFTFFHFESHAGSFVHHFEVNGFTRLHSYDKFISFRFPMKNISGYIVELDPNFGFALVQSWNRFKFSK